MLIYDTWQLCVAFCLNVVSDYEPYNPDLPMTLKAIPVEACVVQYILYCCTSLRSSLHMWFPVHLDLLYPAESYVQEEETILVMGRLQRNNFLSQNF